MEKYKITKFGGNGLDVLIKDIQAALDIIKERYELSNLTVGKIYFTTETFEAKISGKINGYDANEAEKAEALFFALKHKLPENLIGTEIDSAGQRYTIMRLEVRNIKYPIIAHCKADNKLYKFTVEHVRHALDKKLN